MTDPANPGSVTVDPSAGNPATPPNPAEKGSAAGDGKSWLDGLSEGNRKLAENKGWTSPESLDKAFTSYAELERQQGESLRVPAADAPPEEWAKFTARLPEDRRPIAAPDKLDFKKPEGYPEDVPYNAELADASKPWMHEAGLSAKQAQSLHDKFVTHVAEQTKAQLAAQQAAIAKSVETTHDELVKDWGPKDSDGFKQKLALADRAMKKLGLVDTYKAKGVLLQDGSLTEATIARAMEAVGGTMFKEDSIGANDGASGANPFKRNAAGERDVMAIMSLTKSDPERAKRMAREAGEDLRLWFPDNPR